MSKGKEKKPNKKFRHTEESSVLPFWRVLHMDKDGDMVWLGNNKFMNKSTAQGLVELGVFKNAELWEFEEVTIINIKGQII